MGQGPVRLRRLGSGQPGPAWWGARTPDPVSLTPASPESPVAAEMRRSTDLHRPARVPAVPVIRRGPAAGRQRPVTPLPLLHCLPPAKQSATTSAAMRDIRACFLLAAKHLPRHYRPVHPPSCGRRVASCLAVGRWMLHGAWPWVQCPHQNISVGWSCTTSASCFPSRLDGSASTGARD